MDTTHERLPISLPPLPGLTAASSSFRFIWSMVEQAQVSKGQIEALAQSIAELLRTLEEEYSAGRLPMARTSVPLADLCRLLDEISSFVQKEASSPFLKLVFEKDRRMVRIEGYYRRIGTFMASFQHMPALLDIQAWKTRSDNARAVDRRVLNEQLLHMETNQQLLKEKLNAQQSTALAMIVSLQRRLELRSDSARDLQFFSHALQYLIAMSGHQLKLQNWMITSYEVEFGPKIGSGGFGEVFKGTWNDTEVALKVLATESGITPSSTAIRHEVETWSTLKHPHILQFLGANEFDNKPFIVMPFMKNGNARDYVRAYPDCDRLPMLYHASLGIVYLHSRQIVHGDLKALNILIDASGKAVLCDFGLSRIKADVTSRTAVKSEPGGIIGSHNWMAPEQLLGRSPKKPCDIYAFGMTLYEIFTDEIPMGNISYTEILELVARQNIRPERPDDEDAPQLSNVMWELAEKCWVKDPKHRPTAISVCDTISYILNNPTITPRKPISSTYHPSTPHTIAPRKPVSPTSHSNIPHKSMPLQHAPNQATARRTLTPSRSIGNAADTAVGARPVSNASPSHPIILVDSKTLPPVPVQNSPPSASATPPNLILQGHTDWVHGAAFSPDGKYIVTGSDDRTLIVWDAKTGDLRLGPLKIHTNPVYCVAWSPDGRRIASGSYDKTVVVWDSATGQVVAGPFKGHSDAIESVSFSPNGKQIASGSQDNTIRVWDAQTGGLLVGPLVGHTKRVNTVAFSGNGKRLVSGSGDKTVRVWSVKSGRVIHGPLRGHKHLVRLVAFSPDGKRIVSASWDGGICVWDAHTGALASGPSKRHDEGTLAVVFSPHSTFSCVVSPDGMWIAARKDGDFHIVQVWDSRTGRLAATFSEHTDYVYSVSFSPDSKRILTTSGDKTVRVCTLNL